MHGRCVNVAAHQPRTRAPTTVPLPARIRRRVSEAVDIRRTDSRERADHGRAPGTPYELATVAGMGDDELEVRRTISA